MTKISPAEATQYSTTKLRISSGNGPVSRDVLCTPLRNADPSEIPIIDVSGIFSPSLHERTAVAKQIHDAAANNGFFYIKNTGISAEITSAAHTSCLDFFRQPPDLKERANSNQSKCYNGYKPPKTQRINPFESIDNRESFSWRYDPEYDPCIGDISSIPPEIAECLHSEDFIWTATANLPNFKPSLITYWRACLALARALVRSFALSLDLAEDFFDAKFSHPDASLSLNYYPPIPKPDSSSVAAADVAHTPVSIGSHTDFQLFTILWQDRNGGLQVLNRQGQWINASPVEGTFVVNIADYLQRITNDRYVSTVHRAQNWSGRERVSMPFFFGFNLNESCAVLDCCVEPGEQSRYEEVSCKEWVRRRVKDMHRTEGDEEEKVLLTS
ncbi:2OG-Fe(II) oxygenase [Pseudomassariella vexata]|uniref:2OG-Fe(II) oxygenase n=1 Tax=Pseudomassariella vexata TaxID=1141098 RepID=A0A1Y2DHG7_9PEZI|nr:2OG-Fe(II) oxygenase [Pseudomassariella vexata]ORY58701.1 2OG-Fe(II) oxygenase [Pseudomassariella vexata]